VLTFIGGVVSLAAGICLWNSTIAGHQLFRLFLKALAASVPFCLVIIGLVAIVAGISSMKEKAAEKK
jgi:hypothetical protein